MSTTRGCDSGHHMRGRPLLRSMCDVRLLVRCIWPFPIDLTLTKRPHQVVKRDLTKDQHFGLENRGGL